MLCSMVLIVRCDLTFSHLNAIECAHRCLLRNPFGHWLRELLFAWSFFGVVTWCVDMANAQHPNFPHFLFACAIVCIPDSVLQHRA